MSYTDEELDAFARWERQAWETCAAPYSAAMTTLTSGAAGALLDAAGVEAGTRLLDVATGPGVVALAALARGAEVIAVAAAAPRTGAVLAATTAEGRAELRRRYVEEATTSYGRADGLVTLPAAAVVGSGRSAYLTRSSPSPPMASG